MKHVVEVAHLVNGEPVSVRKLSAAHERLAAAAVVASVLLLHASAMVAALFAARILGRPLYGPPFLAIWIASAALVAGLAARQARRRANRYTLGTRLEADAFCGADVDLVRRIGDRFVLSVVPGMNGRVEAGRSGLPVEALVSAERGRSLPLDPGATATVSLGSSTFVVRSRPAADRPPVAWSFARLRPRARGAGMGIALALAASLFCVLPARRVIGTEARLAAARAATTPWEAEKVLRIEAQLQAGTFHQCFDPLPLSCQRPGYVGVGLSLNRDGEVRSRWITRSTYGGAECPIEECMKEVISTWTFHPLPEPMRVVLPVQVLRTARPLPQPAATASAPLPGAGEKERGSRCVLLGICGI